MDFWHIKWNNTSKSIKKVIEQIELDCVRFAEEFEDLISEQESDILQKFLGVSSPNIIRKVFLGLAIKFNTDFSNKTIEEKAEINFFNEL